MATAILITSIGVYFGFLNYTWFYFSEDRLFRLPPEIWRLATNFWLSSPKLGIVMDPWFGKLPLLLSLVLSSTSANKLRSSFPIPEPARDQQPTIPEQGGRVVVSYNCWGNHHCRFFLIALFFSLSLQPTPRISARIVHASTTMTVPGNEED